MREELAREFPSAGRALSTTRSQILDRAAKLRGESAGWATVSGIGAGFLAAAVLQFVVGLFFLAVRALDVTTPGTFAWLPSLAGTGAAVAVALRVGGPLSVAMYLVYVALGMALQVPGLAAFCERSGSASLVAEERCTPLGFVASQWAVWCGIGVGLLLSRVIAARGEGKNLTMRVAGAYAIAWQFILGVFTLALAQSAAPVVALNYSLAFSALAVAAGAAAGVVAATSEHRARTATIVAIVLVLPWLTTHLPLLVSQIGMAAQNQTSSEFLPAILIGAFTTPVAALALVLTAVVADRQRFIPRDAA